MQTYTFDLILSRDLTDDEIESIGAWVEDGGDAPASVEGVTLSTSEGIQYATCTARAISFDQALASVLPGLTKHGVEISRIELAPDFAHAA